jgi:hypothetical protein
MTFDRLALTAMFVVATAAPAFADSKPGIVVAPGPPQAVMIPPPEFVPTPPAPLQGAPPSRIEPLPPLVIYSTPLVAGRPPFPGSGQGARR